MYFKSDDGDFSLLCGILGDPISFAIIRTTMRSSKSAIEISKINQLPVSSVYKKIRRLQTLGIVVIENITIDGRSGKRIALYRCVMKSFELQLTEEGHPRVSYAPVTIATEVRPSNPGNNVFSVPASKE